MTKYQEISSSSSQTEGFDELRVPTILFVVHVSPFSRVGGTELHVRGLLQALALPSALVAYPFHRELVLAEVFKGDIRAPHFYRFGLRQPTAPMCISNAEVTSVVLKWIDLFAISGVHIHHLLGWPIELGRVLTERQVPYIYTSHDYYAVCPNWFLFDYESNAVCPCDWKDESDAGCLPSFAAELGLDVQTNLGSLRASHRRAFLEFTAGARAVVFPSNAARSRVSQALGLQPEKTAVIEHGSDVKRTMLRAAPSDKMRLAVVGNVATPIKGEENYRQLIRLTNHLPIEWHFFGESQLKGINNGNGCVRVHGAYRHEDIANLLATAGIDVVVILPNVDETYSYILSESLAAGIPVLTNGRGSLLERVQTSGAGVVVKDLRDAYCWIEHACRSRAEVDALAKRARAVSAVTVSENAQAHNALYRKYNLLDERAAPLPRPERLRGELLVRRVSTDPAQPIVDPPPQYQKSWWYPAFRAIKWLIPAPIRALGRRVMVARERRA